MTPLEKVLSATQTIYGQTSQPYTVTYNTYDSRGHVMYDDLSVWPYGDGILTTTRAVCKVSAEISAERNVPMPVDYL